MKTLNVHEKSIKFCYTMISFDFFDINGSINKIKTNGLISPSTHYQPSLSIW